MKQLYLLEKSDLAALREGRPFEIHVAGQVIILQAEGRKNGATSKSTRGIDPEIKRKAIAMLKGGKKPREVADAFGLNRKSVYNWVRK